MRNTIFLLSIFLLAACQEETERADAYGNFETNITTISAEANGKLLFLTVEEGQELAIHQQIGLVDTTQLHLQKLQLEATMASLSQKLRTAAPEILVLEDQKQNLLRERDRVKQLLESKAATPKQLDDLNGELEVLDQRIEAASSNTKIANRAILAERAPLKAQIELIKEQIRRSHVVNPIQGTVLTKLAESSEIVRTGTPLYRIGRLDTVILRAYASGVQLQNVSMGQSVDVLIDQGEDAYETLKGQISWIADQAEFTPKTIQTKEDRVNLVYAMKILVPNPEKRLKIGMPAEVAF